MILMLLLLPMWQWNTQLILKMYHRIHRQGTRPNNAHLRNIAKYGDGLLEEEIHICTNVDPSLGGLFT
jgi:hypothetical protein